MKTKPRKEDTMNKKTILKTLYRILEIAHLFMHVMEMFL